MIFETLIRTILEGVLLIATFGGVTVKVLQGDFVGAGVIAFGAYVVHGLIAPLPRDRKRLEAYFAQLAEERQKRK